MLKGLVAGALAAVLLVGAAPSSSSTMAIARFREVERAHSLLGSFAGATETWRTAVLLARQPRSVGTGYMACVRIARSRPARQCVGTYRLPEGSVHVAGVVHSRARFTLLVTATDGVYEGLNGSVGFVQIDDRPRHAFVTFYFK